MLRSAPTGRRGERLRRPGFALGPRRSSTAPTPPGFHTVGQWAVLPHTGPTPSCMCIVASAVLHHGGQRPHGRKL